MKEMMEKGKNIVKDFANLDCMAIPTLCMAIDQVALQSGMTSIELLDFIRPVIAQVNEEMRDAGLVKYK